ncbi:MAG TPA: FHA domain-containing protein [Gemmataceae bacterium]|jgi:hypothetical protein|nr:FHA domain-containing protein [Gemmataceae bacterium]
MADPRLNSGHFERLPRRDEYRRARQGLLDARGWLTLAAERVHGLVAEVDDWPSLLPVQPEHFVPGANYLLVDQQAGCRYPLQTGLNTIGRLPSNDVVLEESMVSRRHCVVLVHAWGGCELHDTASRNGTFVNGQRVRQPVRLASGDGIQVCNRFFLLIGEKEDRADIGNDSQPGTVPQ